MPDHVLEGCRPRPLAHYLKALAVLRLVAEQVDGEARGSWRDGAFVLRAALDREELERFFLDTYAPTPIIAPWNGGSGFYPKDNKKAFDAVTASRAPRLRRYGRAIEQAAAALRALDIESKVSSDEKLRLLQLARNTLDDDVLGWIDAAFVLTDEGAKYPPLLGTGGNDGRLEFTRNFMERLTDLMDPDTGRPRSEAAGLLTDALFDEPVDGVKSVAIGQFMPGGAGGANAATGFDGDALVNPWDFVFMMEGAILFASAAARQLERETSGTLSYPFTVRPSGVGYGSASSEDEGAARGEMWLPLWHKPISLGELRALLGEGRARVGKRPARNGVDFARAVSSLGVDRGIDAFERYSFQVRNGLSYLATPLGSFEVRVRPSVRLLDDIDGWLDKMRSQCRSRHTPAAIRRALARVDTSVVELCRLDDPRALENVFLALGACERVLASRVAWARKNFVPPVPPLRPAWLERLEESCELRLAAAAASVSGLYGQAHVPLRCQLEPVRTGVRDGGLVVWWNEHAGRDVVSSSGPLSRTLNRVLARRLLKAQQHDTDGLPDRGRVTAAPADIDDFIEERTDDRRLSELLWSCMLVDWLRLGRVPWRHGGDRRDLPAFYALLRLALSGKELVDEPIPLEPRMQLLAQRRKGNEAARVAIRRLRSSGLAPAVRSLSVRGSRAERTAAALVFPISRQTLDDLASHVLRPRDAAPATEQLEGAPL